MQERTEAYLDGVRWVKPSGMHLTVKFIGEVEEKKLPAITAAMSAAVAAVSPFILQLGGAGVFPSPRKASVIWTGLTAGKKQLQNISASINRHLEERGFIPERRRYIPHLTLGRLRRPQPAPLIERFLEAEKGFLTENSAAGSLVLYQSKLTGQGAQYTVIDEIIFH